MAFKTFLSGKFENFFHLNKSTAKPYILYWYWSTIHHIFQNLPITPEQIRRLHLCFIANTIAASHFMVPHRTCKQSILVPIEFRHYHLQNQSSTLILAVKLRTRYESEHNLHDIVLEYFGSCNTYFSKCQL